MHCASRGTVYANDSARRSGARDRARSAYGFSPSPKTRRSTNEASGDAIAERTSMVFGIAAARWLTLTRANSPRPPARQLRSGLREQNALLVARPLPVQQSN